MNFRTTGTFARFKVFHRLLDGRQYLLIGSREAHCRHIRLAHRTAVLICLLVAISTQRSTIERIAYVRTTSSWATRSKNVTGHGRKTAVFWKEMATNGARQSWTTQGGSGVWIGHTTLVECGCPNRLRKQWPTKRRLSLYIDCEDAGSD
jgi:hypothetical protein